MCKISKGFDWAEGMVDGIMVHGTSPLTSFLVVQI